MLKLLQRTECPPDQFRYKHRQSGYTDKCFTWDGLVDRVKAHCHFNGYPPVPVADIEDQLCKLLPPGWCVQDTGEAPQWFIDSRVHPDDIVRGTDVLAALLVEKAKSLFTGKPVLVEKSVAAERAAICATCPFAANAQGCGPCAGISNAVAAIVGSETLPSDEMLANKACLICKCAARAQAWVPVEILARGVTDEMMEQFPAEWCWKRAAVAEFRSSQAN